MSRKAYSVAEEASPETGSLGTTKPKVTGSNPVPATIESPVISGAFSLGSNGIGVVLPTSCPQESVQIGPCSSPLVHLENATGGFRGGGGWVSPWESAQRCNRPQLFRRRAPSMPRFAGSRQIMGIDVGRRCWLGRQIVRIPFSIERLFERGFSVP